jgi:hypothetical protein
MDTFSKANLLEQMSKLYKKKGSLEQQIKEIESNPNFIMTVQELRYYYEGKELKIEADKVFVLDILKSSLKHVDELISKTANIEIS